MKVLMLLQLLFFSKLMIDVCGHMCPLDWEINPPPIFQMASRSPFFVSKVIKKTYQWSQLGEIDPE